MIQALNQDAQFVISRVKTRLMIKHPFFGAIAMGMQFIEDSSISTMCTDGRTVNYSPDFVLRLPFDQVLFVVVHEIMHVALKHPMRCDGRDHEVWNMATDYAINQICIDSGLEMPPEGLFDPQYKGMSAEAIYPRLLDTADRPQGEGWRFGDIKQPTNGDGDPVSGEELEEMEAQADRMVMQAATTAKSIGKVPAGLDELVNMLTTNKVDWRDKLRLFVGGDQPDDYTMRKPNRKMLASCGIYMPSVEHNGVGNIVAVIDSSCSVTQEELNMYLSELNAISEDMCPTSVTIITCDTQVQSVTTYYEGEVIESLNAKGRGGTRVTPAFKYVDEQGLPVDSMVYFTDLYVHDFPQAPDYPVLWVSTGATAAPFGDVVSVS